MKRVAREILAGLGFEVRRVAAPCRSLGVGLANLARRVHPSTVIDVGVGDGTPDLYRCFPDARYLLIDANPASANALAALSTKLDAAGELVFCGRKPGSVKLKVYSEASKSSRYESARGLSPERELLVPVQTLDALVEKHQLEGPYLLKIDVEGSELEVLQGAVQTLRSTDAVIAEASIAPRFRGGTSFDDLVAIMSAHGFATFDFLNCFDYPERGRLYQADVVFVKSDARFRTIENPSLPLGN